MPNPTPLQWLERMYAELIRRQPVIQLMDDYYNGDHPLPFLAKAHNAKMHDEFRQLLEDSRANFMQLVVDAPEERLRVEGFRLSASADAKADEESWRIWQENQMDAESQTAILEAINKGVSYLSVWAGPSASDTPVIAVEDPMQTIVAYRAGSNFRVRDAALKVWTDDWTGEERANVWLPDGIYKFVRKKDDGTDPATPASAALMDDKPRWVELEDEYVPNPIGIVSIVPLRNRPRLFNPKLPLYGEGESEIRSVYRVQNQINGFLFLLALAGYFGAHKQRWATGVKLMYDEQTGKPVEPWDIAIDTMLTAENPSASFGEFTQTDLGNYIKAIEQKVLHIAVTTRTPRHYLIEQGQSPSGDAIRSAESGLVNKVERKMRPFGEGFEEAIRLARKFARMPDMPADSETVWADPSVRTDAERTDAAIKRFQAGITPWEQTCEDLGYTQTQIARMSAQRSGDALLQAILNPPKTPTPPPIENAQAA